MNDPEQTTRPDGTRDRRVVIAGAGIAGLSAALRLRRAGWEVLVVERAPGRRSGGYLVNLSGFGYDAARRLGLLPELTACDIGWFTSILVHADGREKFTVPTELARAVVGSRMLSVFRGDVETALYEAVRQTVTIRFGTTVRAASQYPNGVRITLSDGSSVEADMLIGADGLHSRVRELIFGPGHRVDLGHIVTAFPLSRVPGEVPEGAGTTFIGPGRTAAVINVGPRRSSAFFTYRTGNPAAELSQGPVSALRATFADLGGGVPEALCQLESDPEAAYFDAVSQVVLPRWSDDRIVLLGDAAWCVTPFAGYGVGLALFGADLLGTLLEEHGDDVAAAAAHWEQTLRPMVGKRQALARKGAARFAPPTRLHVWLSEMTMRAMAVPGVRGAIRRSIERENA
ncbi:FAD-dependent oxidoreductase [Nocardia transvalensis]|uniref:FAD-dependent oxidoreductase n=1 Tax=Nocardia transvalensis TaxID=37333 RepID=UPI002B4B69BA|nr:FAD-dependent oxidoreductase [Nocardia transvalensis]